MANNIPVPPPPPTPPQPGVPEAAYVEEYNEETQAAHPETRQTANISSKRSKPDVGATRNPRDEFSDSGRSSQTVATLESSAPSSLESKPGSNTARVGGETTASKRKPSNTEKVAKFRSHSPQKTVLARRESQSQKLKPTISRPPCDCTECKTQRRASMSHEKSNQQDEKPKSKSKSKSKLAGFLRSSKPSPVQKPPDVPILQPPARPRASTSQSYHQPRPLSFHAGSHPEPTFMPAQPLLIERQPSFPVPSPFMPPSYPPPQPSYFPQAQGYPPPQDLYIALPSPYTARPRPRQWHSGTVPSRPHSLYYEPSPPIIEHGEEPIYTTIAPGIRPPSRQLSHREPPKPLPKEPPKWPDDYYKMPPPPAPKPKVQSKQEQRPTMVRHAHTTSDAHDSLHKRRSVHAESTRTPVINRSPVKQTFADHERSRRPEPKSAKRSDETVASVQSIERSMGRTNPAKSDPAIKEKRRASIYGHETLHDLEESVETYQAAHRSPVPIPTNPIDALVRTRKKTSSDTSSRQSGKSGKSKTSKEGSDVRSRRPSSEVKPHNDKFALRFNASQDINFDLKSGIEGRTISVRPSKDGDGDMELSIGARGRAAGVVHGSSRPPVTGREKSRRRYSYIEGQGGVTEVEREKLTQPSRPASRGVEERRYEYRDDRRGTVLIDRTKTSSGSRPPRGTTYLDEVAPGRQLQHVSINTSIADSIREEQAPRIIAERVVTTTRSRSRRSNRGVVGGYRD